MKKTVLVLLVAFISGFAAKAQKDFGEDSLACQENLYIYYELARKKQYLEAYDSWKHVYENCPKSSKNNFIYGPYIVKAKIKEAEGAGDEAKALEFKNMLMQVYNKRNINYPGQEGKVYAYKALDMVKYFKDSSEVSYKLFKQALEIGGQKQSAAFYNYYFVTAARLFNSDVFKVEDVFTAYNLVVEGIEYNTNSLNETVNNYIIERDSNSVALTDKQQKDLAKSERELERYQKVESNIEKILAPIATCEKLTLIYNDLSFAENGTDTLWLKRAVKMLQKERKNKEGEIEDCTDQEIYFKISDALYKMEPSAPAARAMYIMAAKDKNYSKAVQYIKEAIGFEVDPLKKANDYYRLSKAYYAMGSLAAAKSNALRAASLKKGWGDPYVLVAQVYAAADGSCGSNVFEKKAVYWAAIDKLNYAKSIDSSVSSKASKLISVYKQQIPDKTISFNLGHTEGESYTIGCFVNETITVKF